MPAADAADVRAPGAFLADSSKMGGLWCDFVLYFHKEAYFHGIASWFEEAFSPALVKNFG